MSRFLENSTWHKVVSEEQRYLIQIVMTEHCNLSCSYCYQSHRGKKDIDYPRVRATLIDTLKAINGAKRITIHFFGGEPLMAFENIIRLTEDAQQFWEEHDWPSTGLVFGIVTNGTLLSSEMKRWLEQLPMFLCF